MTAIADDHAVRAYDVFAEFYDEFTGDHDHGAWTAALERVALDAGLAGTRLLDLACGTGNSFGPMLERGYEVTACDASPAMVTRAADKADGRARVVVADLRALPLLGEFDLVWCLGDALNYLQSGGELTAAFAGARRNLADGGVLVFDVNTLGTFRRLYSSLLVQPRPERVIVLDGHGDPELEPGGSAEVWIDRLVAAEEGRRWRRERTIHHHRHHPPARVRSCLREAGLEATASFGSDPSGGLDPAPDESRHAKTVYTARRGAPETGQRR